MPISPHKHTPCPPASSYLPHTQDNGVSLTATNVAAGLLRPERGDHVHMVTVVAGEAQRGEGQALLDRFIKAFRGSADVTTHVLVRMGGRWWGGGGGRGWVGGWGGGFSMGAVGRSNDWWCSGGRRTPRRTCR